MHIEPGVASISHHKKVQYIPCCRMREWIFSCLMSYFMTWSRRTLCRSHCLKAGPRNCWTPTFEHITLLTIPKTLLGSHSLAYTQNLNTRNLVKPPKSPEHETPPGPQQSRWARGVCGSARHERCRHPSRESLCLKALSYLSYMAIWVLIDYGMCGFKRGIQTKALTCCAVS